MDSPHRPSHAPVIVSTTPARPHVVKIRVNPVEPVPVTSPAAIPQSGTNTVRINISADYDDMRGGSPYYFYASGHSSPSDTLDSGTCSDLDGGTPPPLAGKTAVTVTVNHQRGGSLTSSGADVESEDEISCDSLNSSELDGSTEGKHEDGLVEPVNRPQSTGSVLRVVQQKNTHNKSLRQNQLVETIPNANMSPVQTMDYQESSNLPDTVLQDIRDRASRISLSDNDHKALAKETSSESNTSRKSVVEERTYEDRKKHTDTEIINPDSFYNFHLNEKNCEPEVPSARADDEDSFAGCKGYQEGNHATATIRSSKGTIRGVKNRVRAGIATFLQMHATKSWQEREAGKVVVYTTTMGIVRETYQRCLKVRQILRTHLVKFDERDVFMSREVQTEIRERMSSDQILVPQVFIEGQYIGDAEAVERLNESGELRRILKPYKSPDACTTCQVCGGYRLLPCAVCNGSKKSVHRNHFTTELVALKCMNCDEVGLVKCYAC